MTLKENIMVTEETDRYFSISINIKVYLKPHKSNSCTFELHMRTADLYRCIYMNNATVTDEVE